MKGNIKRRRRVYVSFTYSHPDHDHTQLQLFAENMEVLTVSHHGRRFYWGNWVTRFVSLPLEAFEAMFRAAMEMIKFGTRGQRVVRPPGARLDAFASFCFSKRIYETVLKPNLAEMQEEYFDALSECRRRKAWWVRIRGVISFWSTVALQMPVSATRMARKLWTISRG